MAEQKKNDKKPKNAKEKLFEFKKEIEEEAPVEIEVPLKTKLPPLKSAPLKKKMPLPEAPKKPAPGKAETPVESKEKVSDEESILKDIVKEAEAEAQKPGAIVHRRYLVGGKGQAKPAKPGEEPEFATMVQDVYGQLKKETPIPGKPVPKKPEKREEKKVEEPVEEKKITIEELLGTPQKEEKAESAPLFAQLETIGGPAKAEEKKEPKAGTEKIMTCPTCGTKNTRVIFCPYCGTGFCANCSPSVKPTPEAFYYTCPKCGEQVTVKRK